MCSFVVERRHGPPANRDPWTHGHLKVRTQKGTQVRLGEARHAGPEYERDVAVEPHPRRTRTIEAGDAAVGSQDSITRGCISWTRRQRNLHQRPRHHLRRWPWRAMIRRLEQQPRMVFLQCAQRGTDPQADIGCSDLGLMTHMGQKTGRHTLTLESIAQIRTRRGHRCNHCPVDTATRYFVVGNIFQDRRRPIFDSAGRLVG